MQNNMTYLPSTHASYTIGLSTIIQENPPAAQIEARHTTSVLRWCNICYESF